MAPRAFLACLLACAAGVLIQVVPAAAAGRKGAHQRVCRPRAHARHTRHRTHSCGQASRAARKGTRSHSRRRGEPRAHPSSHRRQRASSHESARRHVAGARQTPAQSAPRAAHANAALIASVLATPCANTELTPTPGNLQAVAAATFCLVNQERARHNELPLRGNDDLEGAAAEHSREMVALDYFAHIAPSGLTPLERVRETGYIPSPEDGYTIGENIAWGTLQLSTPKAIVAAWIASPEHLANILESGYRDSAVGVYPAAPPSLAGGQQGAVYTQEFGDIFH